MASPSHASRRNSGGGRRLSGFHQLADENLFDENDDQAEREQAAAQAAQKKAPPAAHSPFKATPGHERRKQMYSGEIDRLLEVAGGNQINAKNSWSLDLIDHMGGVLGSASANDASGNPNFQMGSTMLDAGVKIYSYRVDSVETLTYKMLAGLNRQTRKEGGDGDDDGNAEGGDAAEGGAAVEGERARKAKERKAAAAAAALAAGTASSRRSPTRST